MLGRVDNPGLQAEGELATARLALDVGDLTHVAHHLAGAVGWAPNHPEAHQLIAELVRDHGEDLLRFFPNDGHMYVGLAVARAYVLAKLGRFGEALELVGSAAAYQPEMPWAATDWVLDRAVAAQLPPEQLTRLFQRLGPHLADPVTDPATMAACQPFVALAANAIAAYPDDGLLHGAGSSLARRLGALDRALKWARGGVRRTPSAVTELYLAMAYRAAGRPADAAKALRRAIDHDPTNLALYADLAALLAGDGKLAAAIEWVDRALAIDPGYDCVVHVGQRLRFERDGDVAHLVALADFARDNVQTACDHTDLAQACAEVPWLGFVPGATEACVNLLADALANEQTDLTQVVVSDHEPPSAVTTLTRAVPGATVEFSRIGEPDPRRPLRPGTVVLWRLSGAQPMPAVPRPSPTAVTAIRAVARPELPDPVRAYDDAVRLSAIAPPDLLSLLVHPPLPLPTEELNWTQFPARWTRVVQAWACLGLLHHKADQPWDRSTRRQVLVDLMFGVEDWTTEAAMFALVVAAWVEPANRPDIAALIRDRLSDLSHALANRPVTIAGSLARLALNTPELDATSKALAASILAAG